mmetsp:Transcript_250/g.584  ORF Transcript_250/g.584 Transcript_250/m.584 type:complete len:602 (-) Transcript_250:204-2009(-)
MKLLRKKPKSCALPSTIEWKMSEFNRMYSAENVNEKKNENPMSVSVNGQPLLEVNPNAKIDDVQEFLDSIKQDDHRNAARSTIIINGKKLLEIHPDAKLEDVQAFMNSLKQDINKKVAEVVAKANDDEIFNRNADTVVQAVDDYETTLGTSFRKLQQSLVSDGYEEKLGKSFRALQQSLAKTTLRTAKAGKKSSDMVAEAVCEGTNQIEKNVKEVQPEIKALKSRIGSSMKSGADTIADAVSEGIDQLDMNAQEAQPKVEAAKYWGSSMRTFLRSSSPKQQQNQATEVAAPIEEAADGVVEYVVEADIDAIVEKKFSAKEIEASPGDKEANQGKRSKSNESEANPEGKNDVSRPAIEAAATLDAVSIKEGVAFDEQTVLPNETMDKTRKMGLVDIIARDEFIGALSSPVGVDDDVSFESNIEAVEQDNVIFIGVYDPVVETDDEGDEYFLENLGYNLSLIVDGVVLQTMTIGAAAMALVMNNCAMDDKGEHSGIASASAQDEMDCPKGKICPLTIRNDLSQDETNVDINATDKEPEQFFIHPAILEKLASLSSHYSDTISTDFCSGDTTHVSSLDLTTQQNWFDDTKKQMSCYFSGDVAAA